MSESLNSEDLSGKPLGMLKRAVEKKIPVLLVLRNNKKLYGYIKSFDKHFNMLMLEAVEYSREIPEHLVGEKDAQKVISQRRLQKVIVRGDSVVLVVNNPQNLESIC